MADPITPIGNLASGLPVVTAAATAPKPESQAQLPRPAQGQALREPAGDDPLLANPKAQELTLSQINASLQGASADLKVKVDKGSGRTLYSIVEGQTGHVVLQIPSEEVLAMARNLKTLSSSQANPAGMLLDKEG